MKNISVKINFLFLAFILFTASCSTSKYTVVKGKETTISSIKFLDDYLIPYGQQLKDTRIGGLSGIDYDVKNNQYFLISDDPSQLSPARIYKANIKINNNKIDTILFTDVDFILQQNGQQYPKLGTDKHLKPDGESIRYNPLKNNLIWSSEGERLFKNGDSIIVQPTLTFMSDKGMFLDTIPLPAGFHFTKTENGPRKNALFEGFSYADNYRSIYASLEEPRYEDGPKASFGYDKALTRILKFDAVTLKNTAQYAYNLGELPVKPTVDIDWNGNGISEILAINSHTLMVIERAWAKGNDDHTFIKLFLVDLNNAQNVIDNPSFSKNPPKPLTKKLLFDFDSLNMHTDNFEGVTFGPKLPNGHNSLIFIVDDNFAKAQQGQVFLFEVIP